MNNWFKIYCHISIKNFEITAMLKKFKIYETLILFYKVTTVKFIKSFLVRLYEVSFAILVMCSNLNNA